MGRGSGISHGSGISRASGWLMLPERSPGLPGGRRSGVEHCLHAHWKPAAH